MLSILGAASANLRHHGHVQEFTSDPSSLYHAPGQPGLGAGIGSGTIGQTGSRLYKINGVMTFDGQSWPCDNYGCVFLNGEVIINGPQLGSGQNSPYEIETGFVTIATGERVQGNDGLIHFSELSISNLQAISGILARAGITYNQFIELTGPITSQHGIFEITAGVLNVNGIYRNINVGLLVVVDVVELETSGTGIPGNPGTLGTSPGTDGTGNAQTIVVTETAAHATQTVGKEVTITKTATRDIYTTITSPIYNSIAAIVTNFVKQTVTVQEEQVIRSPLPGRVIVNTIPGETQVVLTVTNTATQFFVETALDTITHTLNHFVPNFNFKTVTINYPQTSTVIRTISRTSVATSFVTSTIGRTLYETSTVVRIVAGTSASSDYY